MAGFQVFPSEIIFEILTRTTRTTLGTCRCVCKGWRQLIHEPDFMPTYYKRSKNVDGFFIQGCHLDKWESRFVTISQCPSAVSLAPGMEILAAAPNHGLLFYRRRKPDKRLFVGKPSTHQCQALPNPRNRSTIAAAGMAVIRSSPLRYQIVKLSSQDEHAAVALTVVELFDSESWTWRITQTINLRCNVHLVSTQACVSVHGYFYWMTKLGYILAYHVGRHSVHRFFLPNPLHQSVPCRHCKFLVEYQGELGLCCMTLLHDHIELWVMESRQGNWRKEITIDFKHLKESIRPWGFYNAEIVFVRAFEGFVFYNFRDGSMSRFKLDERFTYSVKAFKFRSDFERVHLGKRVDSGSSLRVV